MSVLRYISIILLNLLLILESSTFSVVALTDADIAVNSLEALSLPVETIDQEIASTTVQAISKEIKPELRVDIQSLLDANRAYAVEKLFTPEEIIPLVDTLSPTLDTLSSLNEGDMFGDFLIASSARLLE